MFSFFLNPSVIGERRDNEERERKHPANGCEKRGKKETHNNKPNTWGFCEKKILTLRQCVVFLCELFFSYFFLVYFERNTNEKRKVPDDGRKRVKCLKNEFIWNNFYRYAHAFRDYYFLFLVWKENLNLLTILFNDRNMAWRLFFF